MATPPASTTTSLPQRLRAYAADVRPDHQIKHRFPSQSAHLHTRHQDRDTPTL